MNAILLASLLIAAPQGSVLEQGLKREVTLLIGEEDGLRRELERLQALRASRVAALQREIATLEAKAVDAAALEASARAASSSVPPLSSSSSPPPSSSLVMREGLDLLAVTSSPATITGEPLVDQLAPALARLEALTSPQRVDTGFFTADGTFRQGVVVTIGGVGVAATSGDGPAGPLVPSADGALQLSSTTTAPAASAARAIVAGGPAPLWPIAFGTPGDDNPAVARAGAGLGTRLQRLGAGGIVAALALLLAIGVAAGHALSVMRRHRAVAAVAGRLVGLVGAGEPVAAAALARTVGGAAGRFLVAVVAVVGRASPEDEVAALSAEATAALQRTGLMVRGAFSVAAAVAIVVAAGAVDAVLAGAPHADALIDGLAAGLLPLVMVAIAGVPFVAACLVIDVVTGRTRELLEVTALRVLDAATRSA
jgi:CBS domain-containing protein